MASRTLASVYACVRVSWEKVGPWKVMGCKPMLARNRTHSARSHPARIQPMFQIGLSLTTPVANSAELDLGASGRLQVDSSRLGQSLPHAAKSHRFRAPNSAELGPISAQIGRMWPGIGQLSPILRRVRPNSGELWPDLADLGQDWVGPRWPRCFLFGVGGCRCLDGARRGLSLLPECRRRCTGSSRRTFRRPRCAGCAVCSAGRSYARRGVWRRRRCRACSGCRGAAMLRRSRWLRRGGAC